MFLGVIKVIFGHAFEASPHATEGFGHAFFWPASSAQLCLRFSLLATSTYLGVLTPHMCGAKKEIGGPNKPPDAHDAGSWGAAGRLNFAKNQTKRSKYALWAMWL